MSFLDPEYLLRIFLVFVRIGGLFAVAPFFSNRSFPIQVKVFLSVLLAYALSGLIPGPLPAYALSTFGLIVAVILEVFTGIVLGFAAQFIFWTIQFAGEILGFQMGLGLAQVLDPLNGEPSNPLGRLLGMLFLMVFVLLEGHHQVLQALVDSFQVVPLAGARLTMAGPLFLTWTGNFLMTALRLASPFMITIFLVDISLGIFARMAPQTDLFSIGLPVKIFVGLGLFLFYLQNFVPAIPEMVSQMVGDMYRLIETLAPI